MKHPNILLITCDQLSAQALPAWGNKYASTPHINALIESGVRCQNAYSNCPLCLPSRASFWTGQYPHQTGILSNGGAHTNAALPNDTPTLGTLFQNAGYRTVHFGKQHDGGSLRGFECAPILESETEPEHPSLIHNYDTRQDRYTKEHAVDFLENYVDEAPFCMVAEFNNPHNICGWIGDNVNEQPLKKEFENLPPLPENLYLSDTELKSRPLSIQYIPCAHVRQAQMAGWDELKIQHYLHAYHYYLKLVDQEIGELLTALHKRSDAEDTLIVFFSDHGDSMAGRWMATKHTSFYEETMHIPLAFSGAGIPEKDKTLRGLCSLIDLLPTLCDFGGIRIPESAQGKSLHTSLTNGDSHTQINQAVFAQWHTEWGYTVEPGRMVRTDRYKYTHYREDNKEELYDLEIDPGEMHNLSHSNEMRECLEQHRQLLDDYILNTNDPYRSMHASIDPMFRKAEASYRHYTGPVAPEVYQNPQSAP